MAVRLPKSVYIHIMKTGGWSVREALGRMNLNLGEIGREHDPAASLPLHPGNRPFVFTFVRHPLSWYRSYWAFRMQNSWRTRPDQAITGWQTHGSVLDHECRADDFETWVRNVLAYIPEGFLSRIYRIYTEGADFVGKVESLGTDLQAALSRAGEKFDAETIAVMPRRNITPLAFTGAAKLSKGLAKKLMSVESQIMERWGYNFIPPAMIDTRVNRPIRICTERERQQALLDKAVRAEPAAPRGLAGKGVVICGGGAKYFPCAWVCIKMLRHLGCRLPIQLWHLGRGEMSGEMRELVKPLGVETVDAFDVRRQHPVRNLKGWELKAYAIIHSPFREVLLLDADNVAVRNPRFLFDTAEYRRTGAIFWPDYGRLKPEREIWEICKVAYRDEPEFESGQILVDKQRCWHALQIAMHLNEHSDFYYRHIHGDKDTFHIAFRRVEREYGMPAKGIQPLDSTMCQHDFAGRVLFQHRNMDKWSLAGKNKKIPGFRFESECRRFLRELKAVWSGNIPRFEVSSKSPRERRAIRTLNNGIYTYQRIGYDSRLMSFLKDGTVGVGAANCEVLWDIAERRGRLYLDLSSDRELTCRLRACGGGIWKGRWIDHEKMPIELRRRPKG